MQDESKSIASVCWESHLEQWSISGLSQRAYCDEAGISSKQFYYHAQRIKNRKNPPSLTFIKAKTPEKLVSPTKAAPKVNMHLTFPNGMQAVLEAISLDRLPSILSMASALSC